MSKVARSLEQLLTFSRTTAAGYFDQSGRYVWQTPSRNKLPLPLHLWDDPGSPSYIPAPDGSLQARKATSPGAGATGTNRVYLYMNNPLRCFSGYVYAPDFRYIYMYHYTSDGPGYTWYDTTDLSWQSSWASTWAGIENVGGGWHRIYSSHPGNSSYTGASPIIGASDTIGTEISEGGREAHFWGAQMEDADYPTPYVAPGYSPRIDWDPETGERKGLLLETASTNLLIHSNDFLNARWQRQSGTNVTAAQAVAPDGTLTGSLVTGNGSSGLYQATVAVDGSTPNTKSVWLKGVNGGENVQLRDPDQFVGVINIALTTEWKRYTLTETQSGGNAGLWINGIPSTGIYVWGAQMEQKAHATSYIPTTTAQVTRDRDVAYLDIPTVAAFYNSTAGTHYIDLEWAGSWSFYLMQTIGASETEVILYTPTATTLGAYTAPGEIASAAFDPAGKKVKGALAYEAGQPLGVAANGTAVSGPTVAAVKPADRLHFASSHAGGSLGNVWIKDFRYFPTRLSNEALQELTT